MTEQTKTFIEYLYILPDEKRHEEMSEIHNHFCAYCGKYLFEDKKHIICHCMNDE